MSEGRKVRLDIGGPKGNAFYVLSLLNSLAGNSDVAEDVRKEMRSGDYNHLLRTFAEAFPIVELYSHTFLGDSVDKDLYVVDNERVEL